MSYNFPGAVCGNPLRDLNVTRVSRNRPEIVTYLGYLAKGHISDTMNKMATYVCRGIRMGAKRIPVRQLTRMKIGLLIAVAVLISIVKDGPSMINVKLRHPLQYLVRIGTGPTFLEEQPDVQDEEPNLHVDPYKGSIKTLCPKRPPGLVGVRPVDEKLSDLESLSMTFKPHRYGGHFKPKDCISRSRTAVIIPYRNRAYHLVVLLNHLIPFLIRQQTEFAIFVVEPAVNVTFNRALLMNVGFLEALKTNDFNCFIFHDVDLVPESDYNMYRCGSTPRHMAVATSGHDYQLPYYTYAGGIVAMSRGIYEDINGHSNLYFGWGGEDDDLLYRLMWKGYSMSRYPVSIARYKAIFHKRDVGNEDSDKRFQLLWTTEKRLRTDGLNSLKYKINRIEQLQFYTKILVDIRMDDYNPAILDFT